MDNLGEFNCKKDQEGESVSISNDNDADTVESFEMVSFNSVPGSDSEELNQMTNSSSGVGAVVGYMQQLSGECIERLCEAPKTINLPNIGVFSYFGSFLPGPLFRPYDENVANFELFENELEEEVNKSLNAISSPESERRHRYCLVKAIGDNCREVIDENISGDVEINLLERRGCINKEDSQYLQCKSVEPTQCMRALFSLILDRDLKTLITFVCILKFRNVHLFDKIFHTFHYHMHTGYSEPPKCLRCLLIDRVNIRLVADYLDISTWRKFYQKVSEAKLAESEGLWKEFFEDVNSRSLYTQVMPSLLRAIGDCEFHSDILLMIKNDVESKRGSFDCGCFDIRKDFLKYSGQCELTTCSNQIKPNASGYTESTTKCCLERSTERKKLSNSHDDKVNTTEIAQGQSVTLKRKNSQMEDAKIDECSKKKAVEHPEENSETSIKNTRTKTTSACETRHSEIDTEGCYQNVERKQCGQSAKKDSLDNLKMDKLKVGVRGYDSEDDSGFSPDPSLRSFVTVSDCDSGVYDQNTEDKHETIPKQVVRDPVASSSQDKEQSQDKQELEDSGKQLECIDAEHQEGSELYVNQEALKDALDEPSVSEDIDTDTNSSFDRSVSDLEKRHNGQIQPDPTDEPFINILVKTKK